MSQDKTLKKGRNMKRETTSCGRIASGGYQARNDGESGEGEMMEEDDWEKG
jgi:hypothetical protein